MSSRSPKPNRQLSSSSEPYDYPPFIVFIVVEVVDDIIVVVVIATDVSVNPSNHAFFFYLRFSQAHLPLNSYFLFLSFLFLIFLFSYLKFYAVSW